MSSNTEFENDFNIEDIFGKKKRVKTKKTEQEQLFDTLLDESSDFDTLIDASEAKQTVEAPQSSKTSFSVRFSVNDTKLDFTPITPEDPPPLEVPVDVPCSPLTGPVCVESDLTLDQILGDQKSKLLYEEEIDQKLKSSNSPSTSYSDKSSLQTISDRVTSEITNTPDDIANLGEAILKNFAQLTTDSPAKSPQVSPPKSTDTSDPSCSPVESSFQDIHCREEGEMIFDLEESDIASPVSQSPEELNTGGTSSPDELGPDLEDSSDLTDFINTTSTFTPSKQPTKASSLPNNLLVTTDNPLALNDDDIDDYPFGGDDNSDKESVTSSNVSQSSKKRWSSYLKDKMPSKASSKESAKTYYQSTLSTVSKLKNRIKKPHGSNGSLDSPASGRVSRTGSLRSSSRSSRDKSPVPDFKDIDSPEETDSPLGTPRNMVTPKPVTPREPKKITLPEPPCAAQPANPPTPPTDPPPSISSSQTSWTSRISNTHTLPTLSSKQQINILQGCFAMLFAVLVHTLILSDNSFLKGLLMGAFITTGLCGVIMWLILPSHAPAHSKNSTVNRDRLRALTESEIVKDWFQYSPDFSAQTKMKQLPYLYIILTDTILTLHSSTFITPENPDEEAEQIIGPVICHMDITGCRVSVEPKESINRNNMWKRRLPIWLRKPVTFESRADETKWQFAIDALVENYEKTCIVSGKVEGLYLFHKQCRYKEMWYELFRKTSKDGTVPQLKKTDVDPEWDIVSSLRGSTVPEDYALYMNRLFEGIPNDIEDPPVQSQATLVTAESSQTVVNEEVSEPTNDTSEPDEPEPTKLADVSGNPQVAWANALFGRFVWNIIRDSEWKKRIKDRIEKKLIAIQLPKNVGPLILKDFNLGNSAPLITKALLPRMDKQGVWIEMDVAWEGDVDLTLETNLNIQMDNATTTANSTTFSPMSLESPTPAKSRLSSKLSATVGHYLKKGADRLNKIPIQLTVKVENVAGRVCVNIAPPPTDCLWYGFKTPPTLDLSVAPKLGSYQIKNTHMLGILEQRLKKTFEDTFVLPSMESVVIPGMRRNMIFGPSDPTIISDGLDLSDLLDVA